VDREILAFDTETTGVDVGTDRIVTASLLRMAPDGTVIRAWEWLADPGVEIPSEAEKIHGVSTMHAQLHGQPSSVVAEEIQEALAGQWTRDTPLVIANAPFDLGILSSELSRHHGRTMTVMGCVIDPIVIDRALDRYRKGGHNLGAMCKHYGVDPGEAHTSGSDSLAAARVVREMVTVFPVLGGYTLPDLYRWQRDQHAVWATDFERYLRGRKRANGESEDSVAAVVIDRVWPVRLPVRAGG
jgi:DNA polymerase III subunit epsilon